MAVHVAYIGMIPVDAVGNVLSKNTMTLGQSTSAPTEPRVIYHATHAPNAAGYPTIEDYLDLEFAGGFVKFQHISNTMIVTST